MDRPKDNVEEATKKSRNLRPSKQARLAQEHLMIPRIYYPFIRGAHNETLDMLEAETDTKVYIPPPAANSEVIIVTGEKDGVEEAVAVIRRIFEEQQRTLKTVKLSVARAQHRYVIGPLGRGADEVLQTTGVSVEVPPEEEDSDTITLRGGDPAKLAEALVLVFAKADSVRIVQVQCPEPLHKFIIGPKGATLQSLVPNKQKVLQIDFEESGTIFLEGPPEEVKAAQETLTDFISGLAVQSVKVHPSYHRHVIGKDGAAVLKLERLTGTKITVPKRWTKSDEITVVGEIDGVSQAVADIKEIVLAVERNAKTRNAIDEPRLPGTAAEVHSAAASTAATAGPKKTAATRPKTVVYRRRRADAAAAADNDDDDADEQRPAVKKPRPFSKK